jgi:hypothetical protein
MIAKTTTPAARVRTIAALATPAALLAAAGTATAQQTHLAFLWHMHQPIYVPYQSPQQVDSSGVFSFSIVDVHNQRTGPYTGWPNAAVQKLTGTPHGGASVSFSGSLIENLNSLGWGSWFNGYRAGANTLTSNGNPRLDLVAFGYHHPLMPLLDERDMRMQIKLHKLVYQSTWTPAGGQYARGMFPPETAFHTRMIPALAAEGIEWVMVDNIHFDRACENYPHTDATGIPRPNRADQLNPDPAQNGGAWVQLNNLWAPSQVSAPFGYQPHLAQHIDPDTGQQTTLTVVPAARYEGNEDGRGGYGAFLYDQVMDQYLQYNDDPNRPMLVLLHHDGDNFGGGSEAYYNSNFQNFVNWITADPDYAPTTVDDYLDRFPVPQDAIIHVAPGSWAGADAGDPEFKKWLGDPVNGISPDINSWAVLTAAKNRVFHADDVAPYLSLTNVLNGTGSSTERAWHYLLVSQASDYWYWDGTEVWDSNVTVGSNQATQNADAVINANAGNDPTPPTVFLPQREPYNPGGIEFGNTAMPSDFTVWTLAYDVSGLQSVELHYRIDNDGQNPLGDFSNETYAGGGHASSVTVLPMAAVNVPTPFGVTQASYKADRFEAEINGLNNVLVDYWVVATDSAGNVQRSDIQHVWVGNNTGGNGSGDSAVAVSPKPLQAGDPATVVYDPAGGPLSGAAQVFAHVGYDGWSTVVSPDPAMTAAGNGTWTLDISLPSTASELNLVFNDGAGTWDNNNGADWAFPVGGATEPGFVIDGLLDAAAEELLTHNGVTLWAAHQDGVLYVATQAAPGSSDRFIYVAGENGPGALVQANWAKAGQIAQWDAFLGNEGSNGWSGWFDNAGAASSQASASILEGTIDLVGEFGSVPSRVHLAVATFGTNDGDGFDPSIAVPPTSIPDGNINAGEYLVFDLSTTPDCPADIDGSGTAGTADLLALLASWGTATPGPYQGGDTTGDATVGTADLLVLLAAWGTSC